MKSLAFILLSIWTIGISNCQTISGLVLNSKKKGIPDVNIFITGSYDGDRTDSLGNFKFKTSQSGSVLLTFSCIGFKTKQISIDIQDSTSVQTTLESDNQQIEVVTIRAGQLNVSSQSNSVLSPLDIVTTAGSMGNILAALDKLPGSQIAGENGRLLVRGGDPSETQTYINGILVGQPYTASTNGVPVRGRFSPFLFKGTNFSTGGYGAEFGNALSGILDLSIAQQIEDPKTELSFSTVGLGFSNTQKWNDKSLSVNLNYMNLAPYTQLIKQDLLWDKPYQQGSGEAIYRQKGKNYFFHLYGSFAAENFSFTDYSLDYQQDIKTQIDSRNYYLNSHYSYYLPSNWKLESGVGVNYMNKDLAFHQFAIPNKEFGLHGKTMLRKTKNNWGFMAGGEYFFNKLTERINGSGLEIPAYGFERSIFAVFTEAQYRLWTKLIFDVGLRYSRNIKSQSYLEPRFSLGYLAGEQHKFAFSYGQYHQEPVFDIYKYNSSLSWQAANHFIAHYTFQDKGHMLRLEAYSKNYSNLITYTDQIPRYNSTFTNQGYGHVRGFDVFWKDSKSINNLQYWLSYSFTDPKKLERNYPIVVQPDYLARHYLSLVGKYWISGLRSQASITHSYISGRPYHNPNLSGFMQSKTKSQHNLSISWSYLLSQQKILFFSMTNVLGNSPVYGYEFSAYPNNLGHFEGRAITPTAKRFVFLGFFWTISKNKKDNQLDQL